MNKFVFSLLLPAFLAGVSVGVHAQNDATSAPVTLNISQVPVQTALKLLFTSAGIKNFVIDPNVQGAGSVGALSLNGVPFSVALKQVLGAVDPPLAADLKDGIYHIHTGGFVPPGTETSADFQFSLPADSGQNSFYKLGIKHYDAGMIADALTHRDGMILLPPNFVVPSAFGVSGLPAGPAITTVGARNPALTAPAGNSTQAGLLGNANVLPPGVKRIFVLSSDNSLVIEATPKGYDNLTGESLLSKGYTQVY